MSQFNGNSRHNVDFVVQEPPEQFYGAPVIHPRSDASQSWMQPRPRSAQPNVRSPVPSIRSTGTAPGQQRSFDTSGFPQGNAVLLDNRPHHDLLGMDMLAPPGHDLQTFSPVPQNFNEESWNIFNLRTKGAYNDRTSYNHNGTLRPFVHGPGSVGSAAPRSDSGYNSQSVVSHDAGRMDHSGSHFNLTQQIGDSHIHARTSEAEVPMIRVPSVQRSQVSRISSRSGDRGNPLECQVCGNTSKCNSDLKYVTCSNHQYT
jgi:hypothetical protein